MTIHNQEGKVCPKCSEPMRLDARLVLRCEACGHRVTEQKYLADRGGKERIHLPAFLGREFGISRSEARRVIHQGGVRVGIAPCRQLDVEAEHLLGKSVSVGRGTIGPVTPQQLADRSELHREKDGGGGKDNSQGSEATKAVDLQHQVDRLEGELADQGEEMALLCMGVSEEEERRKKAEGELAEARSALLSQWESNHAEHCQNDWPHPGICHWPKPPALDDTPQPKETSREETQDDSRHYAGEPGGVQDPHHPLGQIDLELTQLRKAVGAEVKSLRAKSKHNASAAEAMIITPVRGHVEGLSTAQAATANRLSALLKPTDPHEDCPERLGRPEEPASEDRRDEKSAPGGATKEDEQKTRQIRDGAVIPVSNPPSPPPSSVRVERAGEGQ